jgi:uncharacterized protein YdaU (DUF1376 family)
MTWTKLSDDHFDRQEIFTLSRSAALLNIEATVWCNRLTNDGHVPAAMLARLTTSTDPESDAAELVAGEVWELEANGWRVDWTDQETNAKITARHEINALKQEAYRTRKEAHAHGDHSKCDARFCPSLQVVTSPVTGNATSYVTRPLPDPARPVPSRPEGTGDRDRGESHAATPTARREPHQWQDDSSGISCADCGLPPTHGNHDIEVIA